MSSQPDPPKKAADLRWRAEEVAGSEATRSSENIQILSSRDMRRTLHELRVHQIEIEMQNEELRRIQSELDTARMHYFELYDLAPVGYCVLSSEGLIQEINLTAVNLLDVPRAALIKQPITQFIFKEDQDIYYTHRKRFLETGEPYGCDLRMVKRGSLPFWAHLAVTGVPKNSAGLEHGPDHVWTRTFVARLVMSDIHERKQMEEEKAKLESALRQAQKLETLGALAAGVAHDFNNLLTAILGNAILARTASNPHHQTEAYFEAIETAVLRASDLTHQLLAYSGKEMIQVRKIDLHEVLKRVIQVIPISNSKQVTLAFDLADDLSSVMGEPTQVFQILMNLIMNAFEAYPEAGVGQITIQTRTEALTQVEIDAEDWVLPMRPCRYATVVVTDTGSGMTPEITARIFEPFFTTKFTGRGLGLAAVLGTLSSHGGGISVHSEPGSGSSLKLYFPVDG